MSSDLLVVNAGSSSIKFGVYRVAGDTGDEPSLLARGAVDGIGGRARIRVSDGETPLADEPVAGESAGRSTHDAALARILAWLDARQPPIALRAAGHRVVHGGEKYAAPVLIDRQVRDDLDALVPLAPLHQPHALAAIDALARLHPGLVQIAAFDTAFHLSQPAKAREFGLPRRLSDAGIKRYGFHGLSFESIADQLAQHLGAGADGRVIVAHLGHGASLCALRERRSAATTMGFTPLDGLLMSTRCGALDPGVILYLMTDRSMDAGELEQLLYRESGLLGVSGISADMAELLASSDPRAAFAVELFVYRVCREIGSLAAALGGLDALVFTGGIGENAVQIREQVCAQSAWLGIVLDPDRNRRGGPRIDAGRGPVSVWVLPTREEEVIARHMLALIGRRG